MKVVEFNRMMAPHCRGDVAGLPDRVADRAIQGGYATLHDPKRAPVAKAVAPGSDQKSDRQSV